MSSSRPSAVVDPGAPLRVCVEARLEDGSAGGVQQTIIGLARGLSSLSGGGEEYLFLAWEGRAEWLTPYLSGPCRAVLLPEADRARPGWKRWLGDRLPANIVRLGYEALGALRPVVVPVSDGTVERLTADVVHLTHWSGFRTSIPTVYVPHDLQHEHLPRFFGPRERRQRQASCAELCRSAAVVVADTRWGKTDLLERLHLPGDRVHVVGFAPVLEAYPVPSAAEQEDFARRRGLPEAFVFLPAQTWPHKNHLGLLDAIAMLRDRRGLRVPLVCSGKQNEFFPVVQRRVLALGLDDQVTFLGFVQPIEVQCLYRLCRAVVLPSLFEGFGLPVLEAFAASAPLACSRASCLPEVAGDAAVTFDPGDTQSIAATIARVWLDDGLRAMLVARGHERIGSWRWRDVAKAYRAIYRCAGKRRLTDEDRVLLEQTL